MGEAIIKISEKDFMRQVKDLAKVFHWRVYHPFLSKWSERGFPDLSMVKEFGNNQAIMVMAELKSDKGKLTEAQKEWLDLLSKVEGVYTFVWYPHQFDDIVLILSGTPDIIKEWKRTV